MRPPRPGTQLSRAHGADRLSRHAGAPFRPNLRRITQALRARQHSGQSHLGIDPSVVLFATHREDTPREVENLDSRYEWQIEKFGELRRDLSCVCVQRVLSREYEIEGSLMLDGRGEQLCGRDRVASSKRSIGQQDAPDLNVAVEPPGDRFPQDFRCGRWTEREHVDGGTGNARGKLNRLTHRPTAVRAHLQGNSVANQTAVWTERHLLERRDLLDKHSEPSHR